MEEPFEDLIGTLEHVGITVKDLDKALKFYSEILEFPVLSRKENPELKVAYAQIQIGQSKVEIFSPLEGKPSRPRPAECGMEGVGARIRETTGLNHLSINVDNIDAVFEKLKNKGVLFILEPKLMGTGSKIAFFTDPDGTLIELIQRQTKTS